jgi:myosin heavy subunit
LNCALSFSPFATLLTLPTHSQHAPTHSLYLDDAARLNNLHEAALLNLLRTRFENDDIYTYTGDVLISVNPYKDVPLLYRMPLGSSESSSSAEGGAASPPPLLKGKRRPSRRVRGMPPGSNGGDSSDDDVADGGMKRPGSNRRGSADSVLDHPHVYAVADKARRYMMDKEGIHAAGGASRRSSTVGGGGTVLGVNQSIIITGESGAVSCCSCCCLRVLLLIVAPIIALCMVFYSA